MILPCDAVPQGHVRPRRRSPSQRSHLIPVDEIEHPNLPSSFGQAVSVPSRPVSIPSDTKGVLQESHAARELLGHETLVIVR